MPDKAQPGRSTLHTTGYIGTSLIRNSTSLGPYSRTVPRALWRPYGGGLFIMSEVPLYSSGARAEQASCEKIFNSKVSWQ